ncbi:hypothetical protein GDO86_014261 [Hymenochirus boettgeri]|uniref:Uncharacterized protein n=1 Tax=Hymenochirus boettgeri TaxID=247094 RepID=A0A8T2JWC1_9PIPI|nr:hypothetical protein GDO86_014261 [Hymenochirus boettgeri]
MTIYRYFLVINILKSLLRPSFKLNCLREQSKIWVVSNIRHCNRTNKIDLCAHSDAFCSVYWCNLCF